MARISKRLASTETTSTSLTTVYTAPSNTNTNISVISFTNTTTAHHSIDIYINDGSTDKLKKTLTLPGGSGQEALYHGGQRVVINAGDIIKVQSDSASAFNTFVYGSEVAI